MTSVVTCLSPSQIAQAINGEVDFPARLNAPAFFAADLAAELVKLGWTLAEGGDSLSTSVRRLEKWRKRVSIAIIGDEIRVNYRR